MMMTFSHNILPSCFIILNLLHCTLVFAGTEVLRPRGVPLSKKSFYDPGKDFQCLDGSATIPFLLVNDDYCDCDDGSDEPGTNACPNGLFHCSNIGFIERIIPSSRVNDGICDCCDASDEYNSSINCPNNCLELGEQMRLEREQYLELLKQGNQIRNRYIEEAKIKIEETKKELENLKANLAEAEALKNSRLEVKTRAEQLEKEALDVHRAKEEELRKQREDEEIKQKETEDAKYADSVFKQLDIDGDGQLTLDEMKKFQRFDRDNDGTVTDDEAKFYSNAAVQLDFPEFMESSWPLVKPVMEAEQQPTDEARPEHTETTSEYETVDNVDPNTNEEESDNEEDAEHIPTPVSPEPPVTLEYDEVTSKLVEEAKQARNEYNEAENALQDLQNKVRDLEVLLENDYGPNSEYMALKGQCFELHENEYIYKLCPFDSASQRPKVGGTETNLGRWGKWIGPEHNPYERFIMEGGAQCWNGPARSVFVQVMCGAENQLIRAWEPNRCEYGFEFKTPAACVLNQSPVMDGNGESHEHTEL